MDGHSRFIVSNATAHHQRSELVLEAFERGIAAYGTLRSGRLPSGPPSDTVNRLAESWGFAKTKEALRCHDATCCCC